MSDEIKNQPAFPQHSWQRIDKVEEGRCEPGMTIRDYFAAHCPVTFSDFRSNYPDGGHLNIADHLSLYADFRWQYADAMLKDREID